MKLGVNDLTALYEKEFQDLKLSLLNGSDWNSVQNQRTRVSKIAHTLHRKFYSENHKNSDPSSSNLR